LNSPIVIDGVCAFACETGNQIAIAKHATRTNFFPTLSLPVATLP